MNNFLLINGYLIAFIVILVVSTTPVILSLILGIYISSLIDRMNIHKSIKVILYIITFIVCVQLCIYTWSAIYPLTQHFFNWYNPILDTLDRRAI